MKKKLKIILTWTFISFAGIAILFFSILFYAYKSYSKYIDKNELEKFPLSTRLIETANITKQGLQVRSTYKEFVYSLDIKPNNNVLDFGTGWGNDAVYIAERLSNTGHLTCLDIDNLTLGISKKRLEDYKNVSFICGDIRKIDISGNLYDAIVIYYVLHCIDKDILEATIKKLSFVLKNGGKLFLREPLSNSSIHNDQLLSMDEIDNLMTKSGLRKVYLESSENIDGMYQK